MDKRKLTIKEQFLTKLYGCKILNALLLDELLKTIDINKMYVLEERDIATHNTETFETNRDIEQDLLYMQSRGILNKTGNIFKLTTFGRLHLAKGGFEAEIKKEKHILYSFWFSFVALLVSLAALWRSF